MTREALLGFLRSERMWVEATRTSAGAPQAAVIGVAVSDQLELVFDTLGSTRKSQNLRADPRIALVMWKGESTAQLEGVADEPTGAELARIKQVYFAAFPDGPDREHWEGITYFRVKPSWIRHTSFGAGEPEISIFDLDENATKP